MHQPTIATIRINGGRLCLDFINTTTWTKSLPDWDFIGDYPDLLTWGRRQSLIERSQAAHLTELAESDSLGAEGTVSRSKELRTALRDLLEPGTKPARLELALERLNGHAAGITGALRLVAAGGGFRLAADAGLDGWLFPPVIVSALELVTSPARSRVRVCDGDGCHWLFLDQSRNATRRWCSMDSCGNRAKARSHYVSHRKAAIAPGAARGRHGS